MDIEENIRLFQQYQKSNRYYSIATLLLLRNYSFFQKICKYCLNAFVNFFLQKTLQIDN